MKVMITSVGYNKLTTRLKELTALRKEVLEEMKEVKENCLSSEDNSELNQYRMQIDSIEDSMYEINKVLNGCRVIDVAGINNDKVRFGSVVKVLDMDTNEEKEYRIVSIHESDPKKGLISVFSPIGQALMDSVVGDVVDLVIGDKSAKELEVLSIECRAY